MEIHHDKHHAAYVDEPEQGRRRSHPELQEQVVEELLRDCNACPKKSAPAVRNNGGGHCNHSLFWQMMKTNGGGEPKGELAKAIDSAFGSFDDVQGRVHEGRDGQFGSGWAWLVRGRASSTIESPPTRTAPARKASTPSSASTCGSTPTT